MARSPAAGSFRAGILAVSFAPQTEQVRGFVPASVQVSALVVVQT